MKVESESEVAQSCSTLSDPMDYSPPGSSIHGIFQARVLEWVAIAFSGFIVLDLTFRSLIHFDFIFVDGVRECSNFFLSHVAAQFSQHHLLKRLFNIIFSIVYS